MADDRKEEEEEEEDFSFPSIVGNSPCSIDSPPWLYSPSTPASLEGGRDQDAESKIRKEGREKNEKGIIAEDTSIREGSREEKMDMLWEDFNEELWGSSMTTEKKPHSGRSGEFCEFRPEKTGLSRGNNKGGGVVSSLAKRPGAVAFVKALRKLFLLRSGPGFGSIKTQHHRRRANT